MSDIELWVKNEAEHNEIKKNLDNLIVLFEAIKKNTDTAPMLIKWVIFPLISIVAVTFGTKEILNSVGLKMLGS